MAVIVVSDHWAMDNPPQYSRWLSFRLIGCLPLLLGPHGLPITVGTIAGAGLVIAEAFAISSPCYYEYLPNYYTPGSSPYYSAAVAATEPAGRHHSTASGARSDSKTTYFLSRSGISWTSGSWSFWWLFCCCCSKLSCLGMLGSGSSPWLWWSRSCYYLSGRYHSGLSLDGSFRHFQCWKASPAELVASQGREVFGFSSWSGFGSSLWRGPRHSASQRCHGSPYVCKSPISEAWPQQH